MHSSLVGDLKTVRSGLAYFGLTNSGITPAVFVRFLTYSGILYTRVFVFPGKKEKPCSFAMSPYGFHFDRNKESS